MFYRHCFFFALEHQKPRRRLVTKTCGVNYCTFLSVQIDKTTDVSTKEQLSIIVRLDSGRDIVERFLKFVDETGVIKGILNQHLGISDNKLIMQATAAQFRGVF